MEALELACFHIISNAGGAKSKCFEAIRLAKTGDFAAARLEIEEAKTIFLEAHKAHATLVHQEASGESIKFSLLLAHSEDQLMGSELTREFAEELIVLHEQNYELKQLINQ